MQNIVIENYDEDFYLKRLILAAEGRWKNKTWMLENGVIRKFENDFWKEIYFKEFDSELRLKPSDIAFNKKRYEMMNTYEFQKYINQLRIFGKTALQERIALNIRYACFLSHHCYDDRNTFCFRFGPRLVNTEFSMALIAAFLYWGVQT